MTELNVVEEDRLVQRQEQFRGGAGMKKQTCSVWESIGVGKLAGLWLLLLYLCVCVCVEDESCIKTAQL